MTPNDRKVEGNRSLNRDVTSGSGTGLVRSLT